MTDPNILQKDDEFQQQFFTSDRQINNECLLHMASNGISFAGPLNFDGNLHRFSMDQKINQPDEFYRCWHWEFNGRLFAKCYYGTWSGGIKEYCYKSYETDISFSKEERAEFNKEEERRRKQHEEQQLKDKADRLKNAQKYWNEASENPTHKDHTAYLELKKIQPHGVRYSTDQRGNEALVIPIRNIDRQIQGVQFISKNGEKRIHGLKRGNFHLIGEITDNSLIHVSEGFATGSSVYEACGWPVVIAFDCGNLDPVLSVIRKKYPCHQIVIAADDDCETEGNPGRIKAEEAAKKHNCRVILPQFPDNFRLPNEKRPTDFNDLHTHFGLDELKKQLIHKKNHLTPIDILSFLSMEIPPRKLILSPWLPEQGLTMIHAKRGIGKTFVALTVAYAIATGAKAFKWEAPTPKRVLYVDGEMPAATMQERLAKIATAFDKEPPGPEYFKLITPDQQTAGIRDLATKEGQGDINVFLNDFDVLILDNLSTLVRNGAENEAESWVSVQEWLLWLRKQGKSVIMIHHSGKNGNQRGTSKREDILDTVITLKHPKDCEPTDGAKFEIHFEKARGFADDDAKPFSVQLASTATALQQANLSYTWKAFLGFIHYAYIHHRVLSPHIAYF